MLRVRSSPNGLGSDAVNYYSTSAACSARTPATIGVSTRATAPQRRSANGWEDYQAVIGRADVKDHQIAREECRTADKYIAEDQTPTSGQTAIDRFRALSPASQEALLQQRERRSNFGIQAVAKRERVRSDTINADSTALDEEIELELQLNGLHASLKENQDRVERHPYWDRATTLCDLFTSKYVPTATADVHAFTTSVCWEELVDRFNPALRAQKATNLATARGKQANTSAQTDILDVFDPSQCYTQVNPHRQNSIQQEHQFLRGRDCEVSTRGVGQRSAVKPENSGVEHTSADGNRWDSSDRDEDGCFGFTPPAWSKVGINVANINYDKIDTAIQKSRPLDSSHDGGYADDGSGGSNHCEERGCSRSHAGPSISRSCISPDLSDFSSQHFRARSDSLSTDASNKATAFTSAHRSSIGEHLVQRTTDELGDNDDVTHSRPSTPVWCTPSSGSKSYESRPAMISHGGISDDFSHDDDRASRDSDNEAKAVLRHVLESTVGEEQVTQFLWHLLDDLICNAQTRPNNLLSRLFEFLALMTTSLPMWDQDEACCWDLQLRWSEVQDQRVLNNHSGSHHDNWSWAAGDLNTTDADCRQRWETIKPKDWKPKSLCNCANNLTLSCCCCPAEDTWTSEMDDKLLTLETDGKSWVDIASSMGKAVKECQTRLYKLTLARRHHAESLPFFNVDNANNSAGNAHANDESMSSLDLLDNAPPQAYDNTSDIASPSGETPAWSEAQDRKLLLLRSENTTWQLIAGILDKQDYGCRERFKQIKRKNWKRNAATKQAKKGTKKGREEKSTSKKPVHALPARERPTEENLDDHACGCKSGDWCTGLCDAFCQTCGYAKSLCRCEPAAILATNDCKDHTGEIGWGSVANSGRWGHPNDGWTCDTPTRSCGHPDDVWVCESYSSCDRVDDDGCFPGCGVADGTAIYDCCGFPSHHIPSEPEPEPAPYVPSTVTYWATIESAGKEIHVPISDNHVSGSEKNIANVGMQKVWKWVNDKGLGDKVGLQDAFDLAQSMYKKDCIKELKDDQVH
ncbi:hypothetical protein E8E12_009907 [Didymella heteroderae]|uniref:Myb-like domain-containing protein n=1 Tax=Didymella heteroderae TaxID=1769908 RepID=A0A9P4WZ79_9PLEO|nr:hypothetical protein E8E12_009907 [Didymella heteroderae]